MSSPVLQVRLVDFSPNERYLISYSSQDPSNPREKATVIFNVFDLKTGVRPDEVPCLRVHCCSDSADLFGGDNDVANPRWQPVHCRLEACKRQPAQQAAAVG